MLGTPCSCSGSCECQVDPFELSVLRTPYSMREGAHLCVLLLQSPGSQAPRLLLDWLTPTRIHLSTRDLLAKPTRGLAKPLPVCHTCTAVRMRSLTSAAADPGAGLDASLFSSVSCRVGVFVGLRVRLNISKIPLPNFLIMTLPYSKPISETFAYV